MAMEVVMPQMGESVAEGTITRWMVAVGDRVERDQPLFEISTDKVDAEIPSPGDGVLLEIRHAEGTTVSVDEVVAMIGEAGEQASTQTTPSAVTPEPMASEPAPVSPAAEVVSPSDPPPPSPAATTPSVGSQPQEQEPQSPEVERVRSHSSPVVRKMAEQHGLDISQIAGSGIHGRVTKADVERHLAQGTPAAIVNAPDQVPVQPAATADAAPRVEAAIPASPQPVKDQAAREQASRVPPVPVQPQPQPEPAAAAPVATSSPIVEPPTIKVELPVKREVPPPTTRGAGDFYVAPYGPNDSVDIEPMSRIRQITAAHMAYSKSTAAHVTTLFHVDMSRVARIRKQAKEKFEAAQNTKLTYMPFIFRAIANALKTHRKLNASIDGTNIVFKRDINLGMAVALDWGLIVPVIKSADQLSLLGLAKQANDLAEQARAKKLSPDDIQGGTFTITNPGVYGSLFGTPIINQPQVAILGLGAIEKRPVVVTDSEGNDTIAIKTMCYMAITYDHRLVDGSDADHFMNDIRHTLSNENWNELDPYL